VEKNNNACRPAKACTGKVFSPFDEMRYQPVF
jgi:hypothetical protein